MQQARGDAASGPRTRFAVVVDGQNGEPGHFVKDRRGNATWDSAAQAWHIASRVAGAYVVHSPRPRGHKPGPCSGSHQP